jgi:hypothetical protein
MSEQKIDAYTSALSGEGATAPLSDRELLHLAAKAADVAYWRITAGGAALDDAETVLWNPLKDDGAALRLAINLGLHILPGPRSVDVGPFAMEYFDGHDGDTYAATRRAIVRAAAEIGSAS